MKARKVTFFVFSLSVAAFFLGGGWTYSLSKNREREAYRDLQKFVRVYDIVKKNYVKEPSDKSMVDGAIEGMLEELDPHSVYLRKEDFAEMQSDTRGEFGGLGIEISKKDGLLTVIAPIEDTPAARAGILAGDVIAVIEDQSTAKMPVHEAVKLMRGKVGTKIKIRVKREGAEKLIPFTITRAVIKVKSVRWEVKDDIGVIRLSSFLERTSDEVRSSIKKIKSEVEKKGDSMKGLVLDLRNNPGGLLQQAVEVSDLFLEEGLIVYTQGREEDKIVKSRARARGTEPNYPMVVLINGGSASASEIVAGALKDQKRAHIMGTSSFGKGSVQNVIPLDDGSGIKITVALFHTPSGRQIQGAGIEPDEEILAYVDPDAILRERDLPGHIVGKEEAHKLEEARKREEAAKEEIKKRAEIPFDKREDIQLNAAVAYLKKQQKAQK